MKEIVSCCEDNQWDLNLEFWSQSTSWTLLNRFHDDNLHIQVNMSIHSKMHTVCSTIREYTERMIERESKAMVMNVNKEAGTCYDKESEKALLCKCVFMVIHWNKLYILQGTASHYLICKLLLSGKTQGINLCAYSFCIFERNHVVKYLSC